MYKIIDINIIRSLINAECKFENSKTILKWLMVSLEQSKRN